MTYAEPNTLPPVFLSWQEWRTTYAEFVAEFKASTMAASDVLLLKIRLQRMGYFGARLEAELDSIRG